MSYTLDNIIDHVETLEKEHYQKTWTPFLYSALSQEIRSLYEEAKQIEYDRQMAWNLKCQREDEERARRAEQARMRAIWDAVDKGCSSRPNGEW